MGTRFLNPKLVLILGASTISLAHAKLNEGICTLEPKCLGLKNAANHKTLYLTRAIEVNEVIAHPESEATQIKIKSGTNYDEKKSAPKKCFEAAIERNAYIEALPVKYFMPDAEDSHGNQVACLPFVNWTYIDKEQKLEGMVTFETRYVFERLAANQAQVELKYTGDQRYKSADSPSKEWLVPVAH